MATQAHHTGVARQAAIPRLRIRDAAAAIEFYKKAFGATEILRFAVGGKIPHAELAIGNARIMVGEEALDHGFPAPPTLGGSPVSIHLDVEDADAAVERALAAGARLVSAVKDQFYGERGGLVQDPFGYSWGIATRTEDLPLEEIHRRFEEMMQGQHAGRTAASHIPAGYRTVTPYLIAQDAPGLIDFVKQVFGAAENFRAVGSAGGIHCEVRIGDSLLMIGGGGPGLSWRGDGCPGALHVYVEDPDAVYAGAIAAGAASIEAPADQAYGERSASVADRHGNHWYIARAIGEKHIPEGLHHVNPYLHPLRADPLIGFLKRAFGAEEDAKYSSPEGVVHHARVRLGDSIIEMGEAHGQYPPMPMTFYVYVPDTDAAHWRAVNAGATSTSEPKDQPYGDRNGAVKDAFGNQWYIATHIRDPEK
jgi:PhnB protein